MEQTQKITVGEFLTELAEAIEICFEAEAIRQGDGLEIRFPSGQTFLLKAE
ncbi:MAG: hypothetical protein ACI4ST_05730 [Candidatus Gallimonas sp.]